MYYLPKFTAKFNDIGNSNSEMNPGLQRTSKRENFHKNTSQLKVKYVVAKLSVLDICRGPGYASATPKQGVRTR